MKKTTTTTVSVEQSGVYPEPRLDQKWSLKNLDSPRKATDPYVDPGIDCSVEPSLTDQSQARDCDVNVIVDRFMKTGVMPQASQQGIYGDFSDPVSYQESLHIVMHAQQQFDGLDAKTRARFDNDPAKFLDFVGDPRNAEEAVNLGLYTPREAEPLLTEMRALRDDLKTGREAEGAPSTGAGGTPADAKRRPSK